MAEISNNIIVFILVIIFLLQIMIWTHVFFVPVPVINVTPTYQNIENLNPAQLTAIPPSPTASKSQTTDSVLGKNLGDDQELTIDRVDFIKGNLVSLVKHTYCYQSRLDDSSKPTDQFLEFTKEPAISTHWGKNEFQLETNFELIRIGKVLERQTHRLRFDAISEQITHCDEPVLFNYSLYPVLGEQKSVKNW